MSGNSCLTLRLQLKQSNYLIMLVIFMYLLAIIASVMNSLPMLVKLALLITVSLNAFIEVKRLKTVSYWLEHNESTWYLAENTEFVEIQISPRTVVSQIAIFLQFKTENQRERHLVIFNDALTQEEYRKLIVRLRTMLLEQ